MTILLKDTPNQRELLEEALRRGHYDAAPELRKNVTDKVLDHGYITLIDYWGCDEGIVEAARMSTGKGFLGWGPKEDGSSGDEKLLRYLYENKHSTPFEMAGMTIEVQAPIEVFRQWHRHRTQSYNEMSARYTALPDINYVPTVERLLMNSKVNKQAGTVAGAEELTPEAAEEYRQMLIIQYENDQKFYEQALKMGVPKELARSHLPVGRYSRMRASANLRNWLGFCTLRSDAHAQWEIRQYSDCALNFVNILFPRTYALFMEGFNGTKDLRSVYGRV